MNNNLISIESCQLRNAWIVQVSTVLTFTEPDVPFEMQLSQSSSFCQNFLIFWKKETIRLNRYTIDDIEIKFQILFWTFTLFKLNDCEEDINQFIIQILFIKPIVSRWLRQKVKQNPILLLGKTETNACTRYNLLVKRIGLIDWKSIHSTILSLI